MKYPMRIIQDDLSKISRFKLRCAASAAVAPKVAAKDFKKNPWKLFFYVTPVPLLIGSSLYTTALTTLWLGVAPTKHARECRKMMKNAFQKEVEPERYIKYLKIPEQDNKPIGVKTWPLLHHIGHEIAIKPSIERLGSLRKKWRHHALMATKNDRETGTILGTGQACVAAQPRHFPPW